MKNIVIEIALSNESASMHFLPSDTATVDINKYWPLQYLLQIDKCYSAVDCS